MNTANHSAPGVLSGPPQASQHSLLGCLGPDVVMHICSLSTREAKVSLRYKARPKSKNVGAGRWTDRSPVVEDLGSIPITHVWLTALSFECVDYTGVRAHEGQKRASSHRRLCASCYGCWSQTPALWRILECFEPPSHLSSH